jgi:hypothetical protein
VVAAATANWHFFLNSHFSLVTLMSHSLHFICSRLLQTPLPTSWDIEVHAPVVMQQVTLSAWYDFHFKIGASLSIKINWIKMFMEGSWSIKDLRDLS